MRIPKTCAHISYGLLAAFLFCPILTPIIAHAAQKPRSTIAGSVVNGGQPSAVTVLHTGRAARVNKTNGLFTLRGTKLAGQHNLVFSSGGNKFLMSVNLPAGARLTLKGVKLNPAPAVSMVVGAKTVGTADAEEEDLTVAGTLTSVDCGSSPETLTVTTQDGTVIQAEFDPSVTQIVNQQTGQAITDCATLSGLAGQMVEMEARINPDGSLFALDVTVNPSSEDQSDIEVDGAISATSCPNSVTVTTGAGASVTLNISSSTEIEIDDGSDDSTATCTDLSSGMYVHAEGMLQSNGSVNAESISAELQEFDAEGVINSASCGGSPQSFSFTPDNAGSPVTVTIGNATQISVNDNESATCGDLTTGPAQVEGVMQSDGSVAATQVEQDSTGGGD